MKYMGSKARFIKELKPIIESYITDKTVAKISNLKAGEKIKLSELNLYL